MALSAQIIVQTTVMLFVPLAVAGLRFAFPKARFDSCTSTSCGGNNNIALYNKIRSNYGDLFKTEEEIRQLNSELCGSNRNGIKCSKSDNDRCCETLSHVAPVTPATHPNLQPVDAATHGPCYVFGLNDMYQIVHEGRCKHTRKCNSGQGRCR